MVEGAPENNIVGSFFGMRNIEEERTLVLLQVVLHLINAFKWSNIMLSGEHNTKIFLQLIKIFH